MTTKNHYYAVQATLNTGEKLLCWQQKKHFYFATKNRGYLTPPPPTLFVKRAEAKKALDSVPKTGGNLKQFVQVVEAKKIKIVKVALN